MKPSQALEAVSKIYAPGVAKFYMQMQPDPWLAVHEDLDRVMMLKDEDLSAVAADRFVERCTQLVEQFKSGGVTQKGLSSADAMFMTDEKRFRQQQSVKYRCCVRCGSTEKLSLQPTGKEALQVQVICHECRGEQHAV
jgi:hypothetical protein